MLMFVIAFFIKWQEGLEWRREGQGQMTRWMKINTNEEEDNRVYSRPHDSEPFDEAGNIRPHFFQLAPYVSVQAGSSIVPCIRFTLHFGVKASKVRYPEAL